ncbi:MAG: hypothetical protein U1E67_18215 [Hyphomicrobiales bacterium]
MTNKNSLHSENSFPPLGIANLLHPANAFSHPSDVLCDADLTLGEKRAILAAWASDAYAVEAAPSFRSAPGGAGPVPIDDIFEALSELDKEARGDAAKSWASRQIRRQRIEDWRQELNQGRVV